MNDVLNAHVVLDTYWVNFVLAVVLPMLTALVTNRVAASWVKSVVLIVLSVVAGVLQTILQNDGAFDVRTTLFNAVLTFALAVNAHFGFLKPAQITGSDGAIAKALPGGVGASLPDAA